MDCGDLLTCGECHLVFSLSDIVSFIRHKQSTCRGDLRERDHSDDDDDDDADDDDDNDDAADRSCVSGTAPAVVCGTEEDDKTVICANGIQKTNFDLRLDEHASRTGSTSFYSVVLNNCDIIQFMAILLMNDPVKNSALHCHTIATPKLIYVVISSVITDIVLIINISRCAILKK